LSELFSLGPDDPVTMFPPREFPQNPAHFESSWTLYYSSLNKLANQILVAFAIALGLEENYFQNFAVSVYFVYLFVLVRL
jgi:isopenicillin N synthase-like dioxygenase